MTDKLNTSIIVNTYNRAKRLELCLPAYYLQTRSDFELIIADDASDDNTEELVRNFSVGAPFPVSYVRQEVAGHHRTAILNRAILATHSEFLIFTDADCLPRHDLVEVHCAHRSEKRLLIGGRIRLDQEETEQITPKMVISRQYEEFLDRERRRQLWRIHWRNLFYITVKKKRRPHNYGLNMGVEKWALLAVNGFDENCEGWGNADGELRERLKRIDVWPKCVCNQAVVFHLWHPPHPSRSERRNLEYVRRKDIPIWCKKGIFKLPDATNGRPAN